jgi:UDP-2-acetamido-2,6-beta-L-arabino-hexul-4-ose reductase
MNIAIVGSNSFLGKNFYLHLKYQKKVNNIYLIDKRTSKDRFKKIIHNSNKIFIFAGINRPKFNEEYKKNLLIVKEVLYCLKNSKKKIFFMSSTQYNKNNPYGLSKKNCENLLIQAWKKKIIDLKIYRLPNIFGKWSRPHYNSVVATFCHSIINGNKLNVIKNKKITLLYIDDLVKRLLSDLKKKTDKVIICKKFSHTFNITVLKLKYIINQIHNNYRSKILINYNSRLFKYLYSTYLNFLNVNNYKYEYKIQKKNSDHTGFFLELFKSKQSGQISLLNIKGKNIRGNHFHHTKFEKFLLISGKVKYCSKDIFSNKKFTIILNDKKPIIVNTIPGHVHTLQNLSNKVSNILVWANEIFDPLNPDTFYINRKFS